MKFRRMGSKRTLPLPFIRQRAAERGSILVYIIMVMLIFAVLGVAMVSLFSTSISSSATANETRRSFYLYESGMRYGMSELLANYFSKSAISRLNTTSYKLGSEGSFSLNIFSPCFEANASNEWTTGQTLPLDFAEGKAPSDFSIPTSSPYLSLVNFDYFGTTIPPSAFASIDTPVVSEDRKSVSFHVRDNFVANNNELICIAANPSQNQSIVKYGWDIYIEPSAKELFPKSNGAVVINRKTYYYKDLLFDSGNNRVVLTDLKGKSSDFPFGMLATDFVILSPDNHFIIPTGRFGDTETVGDIKSSISIYDPNPLKPKSRKPDIAFEDESVLSDAFEQVSSTGKDVFFNFDDTKKAVTIGAGPSSSFGAVWFNDDRNIGGIKNFCSAGKCKFGEGIRVFFTLEIDNPSSSGDGLIFALINASGTGSKENDTLSIGGDFEGSELLGYAGDSRLKRKPTPSINSDYLDKSLPRGLQPPKFGLEFDTKVNNLNEPPVYCEFQPNNTYKLLQNTRNDPGGSKNTIQYVFWGQSELNGIIGCGDPPRYTSSHDDNRHEQTFPDPYPNPKSFRNQRITSGSTNNNIVAFGADGVEQTLAEVTGVDFSDNVDWLKGAAGKRQWAIRLEVKKDAAPNSYTLYTWLRQCSDANCSNIVGTTFFDDTRVNYPAVLRPPQLKQTITLESDDAAAFETFIFGFTSAMGSGDSQPITIRKFQLSFQRPNDPTPDISSAALLP